MENDQQCNIRNREVILAIQLFVNQELYNQKCITDEMYGRAKEVILTIGAENNGFV